MEVHEPLTDAEQDELHALLQRQLEGVEPEDVPEQPPIISLSELDGFLTAIVSGPEMMVPSTWLPVIFGGEMPEWETLDEAEHVMSLVFRHLNGIVATLMEEPDEFEPLYALLEHDDGSEEEMAEPWCLGYMRAVGMNPESWMSVLGEPDGPDHPLSPMILLGTDMVLEIREAAQREGEDVEGLLTHMKETLADHAREIHRIFLELRTSPGSAGGGFAPPPDFPRGPVEPVRRDEPGVGRNDPCPCGSGRKYKKCCLQ